MDKSKPTQRPDLFSAPQAGTRDSRRILASLENSGKADGPGARLARVRPGHLVAGLTLLAVLAAAIAAFSFIGMEPAQQRPAFAAGPRQALPASAPQEMERLAAAIVNEPLQRPVAPHGSAPITPRDVAGKPAALAAQAPVPRRGTAPGPSAARQGTAAEGAPQRLAARPAAGPRKHAPAAAGGAAAAYPAAAVQPDSDVALLAALVAHTDGLPPGMPGMAPNRDIVERRAGDSTAALLRRCQRLGGAEAGLCRARICAGQWLDESACRAPLSD